MQRMRITDDIVPVGEFKIHAARYLKRLREEGRSLVITQNGRPAGVLVPTEEYDRLMERQRFVAAVDRGLQESAAGEVVDDEELHRQLRQEFGLENEE